MCRTCCTHGRDWRFVIVVRKLGGIQVGLHGTLRDAGMMSAVPKFLTFIRRKGDKRSEGIKERKKDVQELRLSYEGSFSL
jgi:hypothetical protein